MSIDSSAGNRKPHHSHRPSAAVGKQVNKPFKGSSKKALKQRQQGRTEGNGAKPAIKASILSKQDRRNQSKLQRLNKQQQLHEARAMFSLADKPSVDQVPHRQILVVPLTESVGMEDLQSILGRHCVDRQALHVRFIEQVAEDWLQRALTSDTLLFVVSAKDSDMGVSDLGARFLRGMRVQGVSSCLGIIVHSSEVSGLKCLKAEWLKVLTAELPMLSDKIFDVASETGGLLRALAHLPLHGVQWRDMRPYLIVDDMAFDESRKVATFSGFARGRANFVGGQYVHVPGLGSFPTLSLTVDGRVVESQSSSDALPMDDLQCNPEAMDVVDQDDAPSSLSDSHQPVDGAHMDTDASINEMSTDDDEDDADGLEEHRKRTRGWLPDEFEVPENQPARECLREFRGVQSLRTSTWDDDHGSELPSEYGSLARFQDYRHSRKVALEQCRPGQTERRPIQIAIRLPHRPSKTPPAIWGLLQHEQRPTLMHAIVKLTPYGPDLATQNDTTSPLHDHQHRMIVGCGFRHLMTTVMFSTHEPTFQLQRLIKDPWRDADALAGKLLIASWHGPVTYDPCPISLYLCGDDGHGTNDRGVKMDLVMTGSVMPPRSPNWRVVLERATLTGQPFKVHQRSCIVRWMFRTPEDVQWFKPVELVTRLGKRGHILQSLGTHGLMKCVFDSHNHTGEEGAGGRNRRIGSTIQAHDTILLHLYRRVHLTFNATQFL